MDPKEIEALLAATPALPENSGLLMTLQQLLASARVLKFPFTYNAVFTASGGSNAIAAGATAQTNVQIDAGAPFLIVSQTYDANSANAARTASSIVIPNATVMITDTGSNRPFMDVATPVASIFGTGQFPFILPEPKLMQANSQLIVQVFNHDAAQGINLRLSFHGYKLYSIR
ncbi:MAG: hypothetical protein NZM12_10330 [Steroidobacteraceae bacterium]|nr:hypothetical protein [Steroidobacteraceae bacterium]